MKLAIMQPTFMPWSGYFALMNAVDHFVFLDDVQFDKRSWQQRNKIKTDVGEVFLTLPVRTKGRFIQNINMVELSEFTKIAHKHLKTIEFAYSKSKYFKTVFPLIEHEYTMGYSKLSDLNISLISRFRELIGISVQTSRSSELACDGVKEKKLLAICKELGASEYLSPFGSSNYLVDIDEWHSADISVKYFALNPQPYKQLYGDFISHLSVLDLLMNNLEKSKEYISCQQAIICQDA